MRLSLSLLFRMVLLAAGAVALGGCASKHWSYEQDGVYDPFEGANRLTYKFNKGVDNLFLKHVARVYEASPQFFQSGVSNVIANLDEPSNVVNNGLQEKGDETFISTSRFVINSTFGLGGVFDLATHLGLERQEADFGQTLRQNGFAHTPYIVLPLLGPTTATDGVGRVFGSQVHPITHVNDKAVQYPVWGTTAVHERADKLYLTDIAEEVALDEYIFIRDAYEEQRQNFAAENE